MRPALLLALAFATTALAQTPAAPQTAPPPEPTTPTLTSQSNLVLVPALVRDKKGQLIFSLKVNDFVLTDDGVPQELHLEEDTGSEPLALVVCIEGGGSGVDQLEKYTALESMLDAVVGAEARVELVLQIIAGDSPSEVALRRGIDAQTLGRWVEDFIEGGRRALSRESPGRRHRRT